MDDYNIKIFKAISNFIQDLNNGFGKKYKPVALYNRLVEKTTTNDIDAINRHISSFKAFYNNNKDYIKTQKLENNAKISYSERVYLDIGKILSKIDKDAEIVIHKHLATIYTLINIGTKEAEQTLQLLKEKQSKEEDNDILDINIPNTTEGKFIKDTLNELTEQFSNLDTSEDVNPMVLMSNMMQSGFLTKFMGNLQNKFSNGEMDIKNLITTVTTVITDIAPQDGPQGQHITNLMNQSISQMTNITSGGMGDNNLPMPDISQIMNMFGSLSGGNNSMEEQMSNIMSNFPTNKKE
jgi:hypothetical protein